MPVAAVKSRFSQNSVGWTASAGEWLAKSTPESENIWTPCASELVYYADRKIISGWEMMFLRDQDLEQYIKAQNIRYFVVLQNHFSTGDWRHFCYTPYEFFKYLKQRHPIVYSPPRGDLFVFDVKAKRS